MNKISAISVIISISIHFFVLNSYNVTNLIPLPFTPQDKSVRLEFIEPSKTPQETLEQPKKTNTISEKDQTASDHKKAKQKPHQTTSNIVSDAKQLAQHMQLQQKPSQPISTSTPPQPQIGLIGQTTKIPEETKPTSQQKKLSKEDIIPIPEISDSIFSSPNTGKVQFEAQSHIVAPYINAVKKQIRSFWLSYLLFKYPDVFLGPCETIVWFKIKKDGHIDGPKIVKHKGKEIFKNICISAVDNTAPYKPIPEDIWKEVQEDGGIEIVFTFAYR